MGASLATTSQIYQIYRSISRRIWINDVWKPCMLIKDFMTNIVLLHAFFSSMIIFGLNHSVQIWTHGDSEEVTRSLY